MASTDDKDDKLVSGDDDLVSGEEIQSEVVDDGLDLEVVDDFDVEDFDEDFDDDFEEEIEGEYALQDDKYGKEFDETFGHLTDPVRAAARKKAMAEKRKAGNTDPPEFEDDLDPKKKPSDNKKPAANKKSAAAAKKAAAAKPKPAAKPAAKAKRVPRKK